MSGKLKTLKDIYNYDNMSYISDEADEIVDDIKQVAREWIKELEGGCFRIEPTSDSINGKIVHHYLNLGNKNGECIGCSEGQECCKEYIVVWIKHFFNLEEDE